jgi:hypothetical protein
MSYSKALIYGKCLELYTYEKDIRPIRGKRTANTGRVDMQDVATSTDDKQFPEVQKRRDNARRAEMAFRRLVLANLSESVPPILASCTYAQNQTDLGVAYQDWKAFIGALRYRYGTQFRYICVPEFQKRGAIHFHALFWGLPPNLCETERSTRLVASLWGVGFLDLILTDGSPRISSYLGKYMSKNFLDNRLAGKKSFRASGNILRPITERMASLWYLEEKYGIGVDNPPCLDKEFDTQWLGKGRYRYYNLI